MTIMSSDAIRLIGTDSAIAAIDWAQFHGRAIPADLQQALDWHSAATAAVRKAPSFQGVEIPKRLDKLQEQIRAEALEAIVAEKAADIVRQHVVQAGLQVIHLTRREAEDAWIPAARSEFRAAVDELLTVSAPDVLDGTESQKEREAFVRKNNLLDTINALIQERRALALALDEGRDLPSQAAFWLVAVPPTEDDLDAARTRWGDQLGLARLGDIIGGLSDPSGALPRDLGARELNLTTLAVLEMDLCPVGELWQRYQRWQNIAPVRPAMTGQGWEIALADAVHAYKAARPEIYRERAARLAKATVNA